MDAFESIMERLIEQQHEEVEYYKRECRDLIESPSQFAEPLLENTEASLLMALGRLDGLQVALAKYREEGGRDVITPEQRERLEFLSALEAEGLLVTLSDGEWPDE